MEIPTENIEFVPEADAPAENPTLEEYQDAQVKEYGTYVAVSRIFIDGGAAFNIGHPVPASTVERMPELLSEGYVRHVDDVAE